MAEEYQEWVKSVVHISGSGTDTTSPTNCFPSMFSSALSMAQPAQRLDKNLIYDVHSFEKFLWKEFKEIETSATDAEWQGTKKHEAFSCFAEEMFHRMYSYKERKLETPAEGTKWAETLHSEIESLPEFQRLKARCKGKDWWAGCATTAMLKTIVENKLIDTKELVIDLGS